MMHISTLLFRLQHSGGKRRAMLTRLRKGLDVRLSPESWLRVQLSEAECRLIKRGASVKKLEVLAAAAQYGDWFDVYEDEQRKIRDELAVVPRCWWETV